MRNKEYHDNPAVSQSDLCLLDSSPKAYKEKEDKQPTKSMIFGDAVDCLITQTEAFGEEFYVMTANIPSDTIKSILDSVYDILKEQDAIHTISAEGIKSHILDVAKSINYGQRWNEDTIIKKVWEDGLQYWNSIRKAEDKIIISFDEYEKILAVVEALTKGEFSRNYIVPDGEREFQYQVPIYFRHRGLDCKALLDIIIINHDDKTVQPIDLKTTSNSVYSFPASFMKWKYYIQAAFYTKALNTYIKKNFKGYEILPFMFVVAEQDNYNLPIIYKTSSGIIELGRYGGILINGEYVRGYEDLLRDMRWHRGYNLWEYKKEVYDYHGILNLTL